MLTVTPGSLLQVGEDYFDAQSRQTAVIGDDIYVVMEDAIRSGQEIWRRSAGSQQFVRVFDGDDVSHLTVVGSILYFDDKAAVWKITGTASDATQITSVPSGVSNFIVADDTLYATNTFGLYTSSVTPNFGSATQVYFGTVSDLTSYSGSAYFFGSSGLMRSSGSTPTTIKSVSQGFGSTNLIAYNGSLYFVGTVSGSSGFYVSNGTGAGTQLIKSLPGNNNQSAQLTGVGSALYFVAGDADHGVELWRSDGTAAGTALLKDVLSGTSSSGLGKLTAVGNTLYFATSDLWKSDGTEAGTVLVKDVGPGVTSSISDLTDVGGTLFFSGLEPTGGREMWRSDGTPEGTVQLHDLYPGAGGSSPREFVAYNGTVLFHAVDPVAGVSFFQEPVDAAPGTQPTRLLDLFNGPLSPTIAHATTPDGRFYFTAGDGSSTGRELFANVPGTLDVALVKDVFPGSTASDPQSITAMGNAVYFNGNGSGVGRELFKSDGTSAGTALLKNLFTGLSSGDPTALIAINGTLYFSANVDATTYRIWQSDGTAAGTVATSIPGTSGLINHNGQLRYPGNISSGGTSFVSNLTSTGGAIYFAGSNSQNADTEPYRNTGDAPGTTTLLKDIYPGFNPNGGAGNSSRPQSFFAFNNKVYINADDGTGRELWRTDGTAAGTVLFKDIRASANDFSTPPRGSSPSFFANVNGRLLFSADDGIHGRELWVSDGTATGTQLLVDINPGATASNAAPAVVIGKRVYFVADDGVHGQELWASDGTAAGTVMVADLNPGAGSSNPRNLTDVNGVLTFTANDGVTGDRLFTADLPQPLISAPTGKPDLLDATDSGTSSSDDLTNRDNSAADRTLQFSVANTIPDATVMIYADGVAIGSAVATGTTTVVTTDGVVDVADGVRSIAARQTEPGSSESASSEDLSVTIETAGPTADIVDVTPDPRTASVLTITINFSRPVSGLDVTDFTLTRDGGPNLLTNQTVTQSPFITDNTSFRLNSLSSLTNLSGTYLLKLKSISNVTSSAGNFLAADAMDTWTLTLPSWLTSGSQATWNASTRVLTVTGGGTIVADPGTSSTASIVVDGTSAVVTVDPAADTMIRTGTLTLSNGGRLVMTSHGANPVRALVVTSNPTIGSGGTLDLADNAMVVKNGTVAAVQASVAAAYNHGAWNGAGGITSSVAAVDPYGATALGIASNAVLNKTSFAGVTALTASDVLVKYTYLGDGDLSGADTLDDFTLFLHGYQTGSAEWMRGDYDFSGTVTLDDFSLFIFAYQREGPPL
jgi:ELWxxDGT repeat protein